MPDPRHELILQHLETLLAGAHAERPAHLAQVHRFPFRPIDRDRLSAIVVTWQGSTEGDGSELEAREDLFTPLLELRAKKGEDGTPADRRVLELYRWCVFRILEDPTLGALVTEVREGDLSNAGGEEFTEEYAAAALTLRCEFLRAYHDPAEEA